MKNQNEQFPQGANEKKVSQDRTKEVFFVLGMALLLILLICLVSRSGGGKSVIGLAQALPMIDSI